MFGTKALAAAIIAGTVHKRGAPILEAVAVAKEIIKAIEEDHTFDNPLHSPEL